MKFIINSNKGGIMDVYELMISNTLEPNIKSKTIEEEEIEKVIFETVNVWDNE